MRQPAQNTINYFAAPKNYFWRWAEGGEVIEWVNGTTICYRDELAEIMKGLDEECLPPLSCILLVLAACHDNWLQSNTCVDILENLTDLVFESEKLEFRNEIHVGNAISRLGEIAALPANLRNGKARIQLLRNLFEGPGEALHGVIEEFCSGKLQQFIQETNKKLSLEDYSNELELFMYSRTLNTESLELKLRTGIPEIPKPLPLILPDPKPLDLLDELAADSKTAGLARLAKRIIAALNIPMHSQGSGDQPLGGISDITNRGSFDRLLLSELAHDDLLLMARLVNNEALYLRREEPPYNPKKQRRILIDTSIKMWGLPRIFAVSAALACSLNTKHGELVEAYTLNGDGFAKAGLSTKEEVVATLEKLDNALHCATGLEAFLKAADDTGETDTMLITQDAFVHSAVFQKLFSLAGERISFILSVNRSGELLFYEVNNNNIKKVSTAKFDLEELLHKAPVAKQKIKAEEIELPAFYQAERLPLFFPTTGMRMTTKNTVYHYASGLYGVTETQRLLHWPSKETGAIELLRFIEAGDYCFGFENNVLQYVLVKCNRDKGLKLYKVDINEPANNEEFDIKTDVRGTLQAAYFQHHFYFKNAWQDNKSTFVINCKNGLIITQKNSAFFEETVRKNGTGIVQRSFNEHKKFINNGYNVFHRVHEIYINSNGNISLDYNEMKVSDNSIEFVAEKGGVSKRTHPAAASEAKPLRSNPNIWLRKYTWPNGSYAIIDSNGLAHFKSANANLPAFSMVMVLNKPTACWASSGAVCGTDYFIGLNNSNKVSIFKFCQLIIRPFIDNLSYEITTAPY